MIGLCASRTAPTRRRSPSPTPVEVGLRAAKIGRSSVRYELAVFRGGTGPSRRPRAGSCTSSSTAATRRPGADPRPRCARRWSGSRDGVTDRETVFTLEATPVKFGPGAAADAGWELRAAGRLAGAARDRPGRRRRRPPRARARGDRARRASRSWSTTARTSSRRSSRSRTPPRSRATPSVDGFVSVGGGSSIDTAKVADLVVSHPAPVMDYVNPPVGGGRKPPVAAAAAPRDPDDAGHGLRGDDGRRARHPGAAGQDGHLAPLPAAGAGDRRPGADAHRRPPR